MNASGLLQCNMSYMRCTLSKVKHFTLHCTINGPRRTEQMAGGTRPQFRPKSYH